MTGVLQKKGTSIDTFYLIFYIFAVLGHLPLATCQHSKHTRLMVSLLRQLGSPSANLVIYSET